MQFEDGFLKTEPNIDFEKTLLVDCSKDHYDGGNIEEKIISLF